MHEAIASSPAARAATWPVTTAHLDEPEHGLTDERLKQTDVLTWWGHLAHDDLQDLIAERVYRRVHEGMGLIVLHSGHFSKPFKKLMGTGCNLKWRVGTDREIVWVTRPGHRIAQGIDDHFILPARGDVRGIFRHPRADGNNLHQQFQRWRGVSQRLHLDARRGPDLLLPARPRDLPDLSRPNVLQGDRKCLPLGRTVLAGGAGSLRPPPARVAGSAREQNTQSTE